MAGPVSHPHGAASMASCLELFRLGWDTEKIAAYWNITEDEAHRRLTAERCRSKNLPNLSIPSPYAKSPVKAWLTKWDEHDARWRA